MSQTSLSNSTTVTLPSGKTAIVDIRRSLRARRLTLRIAPSTGQAELVLPGRMSEKKGIAFLQDKTDWLEERLAKYPGPIPFENGQVVPFMGEPLTICHLNAKRANVQKEGNQLIVAAPKARISMAVQDWYRREAGCEITLCAKQKSKMLGTPYGRLTIRDTTSRWGSCSAKGDLNFSWRVVMAPSYVLDYLVAHEVAHLAEMNHSASFWNIVERLSEEFEKGRNWLRLNGHELHRYGVELPAREMRESE